MRFAALIVTAIVAVAVLGGPAWCSDWTVTAPVANGQVDTWLLRQYDRVNIGPAFTWVDNDGLPSGDAFGVGVVATYDLLQEAAQISVADIAIPVQWFVGAKGEVMYSSGTNDIDPAPSLLTGFRFGAPKAGISVMYERALDQKLWSALAPREDVDIISIAPYWRF